MPCESPGGGGGVLISEVPLYGDSTCPLCSCVTAKAAESGTGERHLSRNFSRSFLPRDTKNPPDTYLHAQWHRVHRQVPGHKLDLGRYRANLAHIRQSRPDSGPVFNSKILGIFHAAPSSLKSGPAGSMTSRALASPGSSAPSPAASLQGIVCVCVCV